MRREEIKLSRSLCRPPARALRFLLLLFFSCLSRLLFSLALGPVDPLCGGRGLLPYYLLSLLFLYRLPLHHSPVDLRLRL